MKWYSAFSEKNTRDEPALVPTLVCDVVPGDMIAFRGSMPRISMSNWGDFHAVNYVRDVKLPHLDSPIVMVKMSGKIINAFVGIVLAIVPSEEIPDTFKETFSTALVVKFMLVPDSYTMRIDEGGIYFVAVNPQKNAVSVLR